MRNSSESRAGGTRELFPTKVRSSRRESNLFRSTKMKRMMKNRAFFSSQSKTPANRTICLPVFCFNQSLTVSRSENFP
jgi:hypothetical protein